MTTPQRGKPLAELPTWFAEQAQPYLMKVDAQKKDILENIAQQQQETQDKVKGLAAATLHNDNIPVKERQVMEGNRESYIRRISQFLGELSEPISDPVLFVERTRAELNSVKEAVQKPSAVLRHFFNDEVYGIGKGLEQIAALVAQLDDALHHRHITEISGITAEINSLLEQVQQLHAAEETLAKIDQRISEKQKEITGVVMAIAAKEQSSSYKEYHRIHVEAYKIREQTTETRQEIVRLFSSAQDALDKEAHLSPASRMLIGQYSADALEAAIHDYQLHIVPIVRSAETHVRDGSIELKESKKEKLLHHLATITSEKISSLLNEYNSFIVELRQLETRLTHYTIIHEIETLQQQKALFENDLMQLSQEKVRAAELISQTNILKIKKNVKNRIDDFLGIDLTID